MGQTWCKERASKAQDSKSPLDKAFVRCAHQIYPSLKSADGSVLGGATQRVTSSEIGYAGSPPMEALKRGQSIDSVDRPFHPSEWVDVNLEVPSTPRTSSDVTNLTADTSLTRDTGRYPETTRSSDHSKSSSPTNTNDVAPVPPPRRRRRNRGRPLPPKPDEIAETHKRSKNLRNLNEEPLYSSVKSPKNKQILEAGKSDVQIQDEKKSTSPNVSESIADHGEKNLGKVIKEVHQHKMNGTGRIIPSIELVNRNSSRDKKEDEQRSMEDHIHRRLHDSDYDRFSKSPTIQQNTSTPTRENRNEGLPPARPREERRYQGGHIFDDNDQNDSFLGLPQKSKNYSTVSLPDYNKLELAKDEVQKSSVQEEGGEIVQWDQVAPKKPPRSSSMSSLPVETILSTLSPETADRLRAYVSRSRRFGSVQHDEILDLLKIHGGEADNSSDEDEWRGLDDWDLGSVEHPEVHDGRPLLVPSSRLKERKVSSTKSPTTGDNIVISERDDSKTKEVIIMKSSSEPSREDTTTKQAEKDKETLTPENGEKRSLEEKETRSLDMKRSLSYVAPDSPNSLKSAMKSSAGRKISEPGRPPARNQVPGASLDDWFSGQERSVRFFDSPPTEVEYSNTPGHRPAKRPSHHFDEKEFDLENFPFNGVSKEPLYSDSFFVTAEDFGGNTSSSGPPGMTTACSILQNSKNLTRSLSNESEPFDGYEEKELTMDIRSQSSFGKMSRTISDESIPQDMLEDDLIDEKVTKDAQNKLTQHSAGDLSTTKSSKTPPPSPEPKIKPEILDNDHSTLLKALKDNGGDESNLSSMTPSLTELEAALSDMLEKEDDDEEKMGGIHGKDDSYKHTEDLQHSESSKSVDKPIEPKIVPVEQEKSHSLEIVQEEVQTSLDMTSDRLEDIRERPEMKTFKMTQVETHEKGIPTSASNVAGGTSHRVMLLLEEAENELDTVADRIGGTVNHSTSNQSDETPEPKKDLVVNLQQILGNTNASQEGSSGNVPKQPEAVTEEAEMVEVDLTDRNTGSKVVEGKKTSKSPERRIAKKILDGIFKNSSKNPFEDTNDEEDVPGYPSNDKVIMKNKKDDSKGMADNHFSTNPFDEAPEKPSRLYMLNSNESESNVPKPPQRKHKHSLTNQGSKNSTNVSAGGRKGIPDLKISYAIQDPDPHPDDRLI